MDVRILIKAVTQLIANDDNTNDELTQAYDILSRLEALKPTSSVVEGEAAEMFPYSNRVHIIHADDAIGLGNRMLYDEYGKLRRTGGRLSQTEFVDMARQQYGFEHWSEEALQDVHDFVQDLWTANEIGNYNKPDGTFKR